MELRSQNSSHQPTEITDHLLSLGPLVGEDVATVADTVQQDEVDEQEQQEGEGRYTWAPEKVAN